MKAVIANKSINPMNKTTTSVEVKALEQATKNFIHCQQHWQEDAFSSDLDVALRFNQKIWDIFQTDCRRDDCALPQNVRENLLSLSVFIRRYTLEIMAKPSLKKVNTLITINENIAAGLSASAQKKSELSAAV